MVGCRGISAPTSGAAPLPPSSLTLLSADLFLSYFLTPLSQLLCGVSYSFLSMLSPSYSQLLMGSALASSELVLEMTGTGSVQHGDNFWCLFTEAIPVTCPATKTLLCKPDTLCLFNSLCRSGCLHVY